MPDHAPPLPPHASGVPARRRWGAWLVGLLLVLALAALAYYLVQRAKAPAGAAPAGMAGGGPPGMGGPPGGPGGPGGAGGGSVTVGSALARQGDLPVLVDALGTVTAPTTVTLVPQVSGTLTEVLFAEGQMVRKGQLLARIDPRSYEQTLAQARAARARDEAQLAVAQQTLQRYQTLWQQDSIARQEVDTQAALVRQLQATVASDRAAEGAAELNVGHTRIVAPLAGRVGLRTVDAGNYVSSGSSTGIATITQMDPMDVVFAVPQERIPDVVAAQAKGALPVTALDGTRTRTLAEGQFATLDNAIDTTTGTVKAKARFANADGQLFPNQFVNVRLQLGTRAGVLVPVTAVRTGPQGDYVYVIDEQGVAHMRTVQRGMATVDEMLIAQGLQAGERVVTEGGDRVKDGGAVQLSGSGGAGPRGAASGARGAASGPRGAASGPRGGASGPRGGASGPRGAASGPRGAVSGPGAASAPRGDQAQKPPSALDGQAQAATESVANTASAPMSLPASAASRAP